MTETPVKCYKTWGHYEVLFERKLFEYHIKIKRLTIEPGRCTSLQKHLKRDEEWYIENGSGQIIYSDGDDPSYNFLKRDFLCKDDTWTINKYDWHQIINHTTKPLIILEIQRGEECEEEDIERVE